MGDGSMDNWAVPVKEMDKMIQKMRELADGLRDKAEGIEAVERNLDRISANIKMLEINISDVRDLLESDRPEIPDPAFHDDPRASAGTG